MPETNSPLPAGEILQAADDREDVCQLAGGVGIPGARGRNSGKTILNKVIGWQPGITAREGIKRTCRWIAGQPAKRGGGKAAL